MNRRPDWNVSIDSLLARCLLCEAVDGSTSLPRALVCCQRDVNTSRLILHPTCVIKPAVDGCPLVAANSMEFEKVRFFLLQIREKDYAAPLGGIVRVILSPLVVFPK